MSYPLPPVQKLNNFGVISLKNEARTTAKNTIQIGKNKKVINL